jgi:hypothetical protein
MRFNDGDGAADIAMASMWFYSSSLSELACVVTYDDASHTFTLDSGGTLALNSGGAVESAGCILYGSGSGIQDSYNDRFVTVNVQFKGQERDQAIMGWMQDYSGAATGPQELGTWTVAN